ncbi:MAG: hypothetical protein JST00_10615 [Deltaproteobacteria bacterium]|nr:hypothetical protein [Deltaproteobacteria bacterium]
MRKLKGLLVAFGIVAVALTPGFGAVFTMSAGDRPGPSAASPPPEEHVELVGSYLAMQPGLEDGALTLSWVRTARPLPPGASPAIAQVGAARP